jgi:hypothetical protein
VESIEGADGAKEHVLSPIESSRSGGDLITSSFDFVSIHHHVSLITWVFAGAFGQLWQSFFRSLRATRYHLENDRQRFSCALWRRFHDEDAISFPTRPQSCQPEREFVS